MYVFRAKFYGKSDLTTYVQFKNYNFKIPK